jgi:hypothetical protein
MIRRSDKPVRTHPFTAPKRSDPWAIGGTVEMLPAGQAGYWDGIGKAFLIGRNYSHRDAGMMDGGAETDS